MQTLHRVLLKILMVFILIISLTAQSFVYVLSYAVDLRYKELNDEKGTQQVGEASEEYENATKLEDENQNVYNRPIAKFSIERDNLEIKLNSSSYALGKEDIFIEEEEWKWKETTQEEWNDGKLEKIDSSKDYDIQLRVKDSKQRWSFPTVKTINSREESKPIALFDVLSKQITSYQDLTIEEQSYDPTGKEINSYFWEIYKDGILVYSGEKLRTNYEELGEYSICLTVSNSEGNTSEREERNFEVVETKECTMGLGHPNYTSYNCPICDLIEGLQVTEQQKEYNGTPQGISYNNPYGVEIYEYYDGKPIKPVEAGKYEYELKVLSEGVEQDTGIKGTFTITKRVITIEGIKGKDRKANAKKEVEIVHGELENVVINDDVTAVYPETGIIADSNIGRYEVELEDIKLIGQDASNYELIQPIKDQVLVNITKPDQPDLEVDPFINKINGEEDKKNIRYGDLIEITVRIYNRGKGAGYVNKIVDEIPEGLKLAENNEINEENGWKVVEGNKVQTQKFSYIYGEDNLIQPMTKNNEETEKEEKAENVEQEKDYKDIPIVLEVTADYSVGKVNNKISIEEVDIQGKTKEDYENNPSDPSDPSDDPTQDSIVVRRYVYKNKRLQDLSKVLEEGEEKAQFNLGRTDSIQFQYKNYEYTAEPRGWSTSAEPDAEIEVALDSDIEVSKDTRYYMSYIFKKLIHYKKSDGTTGTLEQDIYVGYDGNTKEGEAPKLPEEDKKIPPELEDDGWEDDGWTKDPDNLDDEDNRVDPEKPSDPKNPINPNDEVHRVLKKKIYVERYIYPNRTKVEPDLEGTIYRKVDDSTITPATINLGTTSDITIQDKTLKPYLWVTDDGILDTLTEVSDLEGIKPNGTVSLSENAKYYMIYKVENENIFGGTTGDDDDNKLKDLNDPTITFEPDGSETYKKEQSTVVKVKETDIVDNSSYKYQWLQSEEKPEEDTFTESFTNNQEVTKNGVTGNNWYLWALVKTKTGKTIVQKSEPFYLDNTAPTTNEPTLNADVTTITASTNQTDADSGIKLSTRKYAIKESSSEQWQEWENDSANSHTFTGLKGLTQYDVKTIAQDNAGNEIESEVAHITTQKEPPRNITVMRYVYRGRRLDDKTTQIEVDEESKTVNLESTDSVQIQYKNYQYTAEPRGWSKNTEPDAEVDVELNGDAEVSEDAKYYMSYSFKKQTRYTKPDGSIGTVEQEIFVGYDGTIKGGEGPKIPDEDKVVPQDLQQAGWKEDGWTIDSSNLEKAENRVDPEDPDAEITPENIVHRVLKKDITVQRYIHPNRTKVDPDLTATVYQTIDEKTVKPVEFSLETTTDITLQDKTLKPYLWVTDDGILETLQDVDELEGISPNGKVSLTDSEEYYMVYKGENEDIFAGPNSETPRNLANPSITFYPDGNQTYKKEQTSVITVEETDIIDRSSYKYQWTQSTDRPDKESFEKTFTNRQQITQNEGTGDNWYLWALVETTNGNEIIERSKVFYLDNTMPTTDAPTLQCDMSSITATLKQSDIDSGVKESTIKYRIKESSIDTWQEWVQDSENSHKFDGLKRCTQYDVQTEVEDEAGNKIESVIAKVTTSDIEAPVITVTPEEEWTNSDVNVSISYPDLPGFTKQYSFDKQVWNTYYSDFSVNTNRTVYARSFRDIDNVGEDVIAEKEITNIDKQEPTISNVISSELKNDGTIKITGTFKDNESGIIAWQVSQDENLNSSSDGWNNLSEVSKQEEVKEGSVTKTGTWYFYAKDKAGNYAKHEVEVEESVYDAITPTITYTPEDWAKEKSATISFPEITGIQKEYSVDEVTGWDTYTGQQITIRDNNKSIHAKATLNGVSRSADKTVLKIDNEAPEITSALPGSAIDQNGGIELLGNAIDVDSGIVGYQFSKDDSLTDQSPGWQPIEQTTQPVTQKGTATSTGTWYFYVKDYVGNYNKQEIVISNNVYDVLKPIINFDTNNWTTQVTVTITYPDTPAGIQKLYSTDGSSYQPYSQSFVMKENTTIYAKSVVGSIEVPAEKEITNIDVYPPTIELSLDEDNRDRVNAKVTEKGMGIGKYQWFFDGSNAGGAFNSSSIEGDFNLHFGTSSTSTRAYFYGLWGVGKVRLRVTDDAGNVAEKDIDFSNIDSDKPVISSVSQTKGGIVNCPYCHVSSAKVTIRYTGSDATSGLPKYTTNQYSNVMDKETGTSVTGHSIYLSTPEAEAKSGEFVEELYMHGAQSGGSGELSWYIQDLYGNKSDRYNLTINY